MKKIFFFIMTAILVASCLFTFSIIFQKVLYDTDRSIALELNDRKHPSLRVSDAEVLKEVQSDWQDNNLSGRLVSGNVPRGETIAILVFAVTSQVGVIAGFAYAKKAAEEAAEKARQKAIKSRFHDEMSRLGY